MIQVMTTGDALDRLHGLAVEFPREFDRAMRTLGGALRTKIRKELEKGSPAGAGLAGLHPNTLAFRRLASQTAGRSLGRFGGRLSDLVRWQWNVTPGLLRAGWIPGMVQGLDPTRAATRFQEAETRKLRRGERKLRRVNNMIQEKMYEKPARPVISPYYQTPETMAYAVKVVEGRIRAIFEKRGRSAQ